MSQCFSVATETRYHGLEQAELVVGDVDGTVDGTTSGLERRLRVLCGNLFNLPILDAQHSNVEHAQNHPQIPKIFVRSLKRYTLWGK